MIKMNIWNREFDIDICYDVYSGEEILPVQQETLNLFLENYESILQSALESVKKYCVETDGEDKGFNSVENIFKYVIPTTLYIKRPQSNERIVALLCDYRFNPDDGLAIVFKNNIFEMIGTENIIL